MRSLQFAQTEWMEMLNPDLPTTAYPNTGSDPLNLIESCPQKNLTERIHQVDPTNSYQIHYAGVAKS